MSKRQKSKEFISSSDSDNSGDDKKAKKKKKKQQRKPEPEVSDEEESIWEIGKKRKVAINNFKGKVLIDIREYYEQDGQEKPGKKGISLSVDQWKKLKEIMPKVDKAIS